MTRLIDGTGLFRDLAGQRRYVIIESVPRGTASKQKTRYAMRLTGVLKPLGTALTRLPFGPGSPDHTAGAAFQMYYQIENFVPWRDAAWVLLSERAAVLSRQCAETARRAGVPEAVTSAAAAAAGIARQIAGYGPDNLRPA